MLRNSNRLWDFITPLIEENNNFGSWGAQEQHFFCHCDKWKRGFKLQVHKPTKQWQATSHTIKGQVLGWVWFGLTLPLPHLINPLKEQPKPCWKDLCLHCCYWC